MPYRCKLCGKICDDWTGGKYAIKQHLAKVHGYPHGLRGKAMLALLIQVGVIEKI